MNLQFNSVFKKILVLLFICFTSFYTFSQSNKEVKKDTYKYFNFNRGHNVITAAIGTAVMNGDLPDPQFGFYGQIGYKRFINPYLNVNFTYNKFNLVFKDISNNGFMSFDLNVEGMLFPNKPFTPYAYAGFGFNASNYFKQTDSKSQAGLGLEYMVNQGIGIKLFSDYNYVFSDLVDGIEFGASNDVYWRIGLGVNIYLRNKKKPIPDNVPTIIKSNPIIHNN
ncbi:Curli production assembly/transport component CsgG [Lacinutrix iliipiscaria]|uniref:Curli production assembly/transport component CsgG n=1 Tax=Lacinutrix iliipiscaria TaxID=1230532 RepID=A0ABW5WSN1_9FLAO